MPGLDVGPIRALYFKTEAALSSFVILPATNTIGASTVVLDVVPRVLRSCGITPPSTMADPGERMCMAVSAVDAAAQRIWSAARWDWRMRWSPLEVSSGDVLPLVELPTGFGEVAAPPACRQSDHVLRQISYEELILSMPDAVVMSASSFGAMPGLVDLATDLGTDPNIRDIPKFWGIVGSSLFYWPLLSLSAVEAVRPGYSSLTYVFTHHSSYVSLMSCLTTGLNMLIQIPNDLIHILVHLASGYLQHDLEFPGAAGNEARGEALLRAAVGQRRRSKIDGPLENTMPARGQWR